MSFQTNLEAKKPPTATNTRLFLNGRPATGASDGLGGYFTHQGFDHSGWSLFSISIMAFLVSHTPGGT